MRNLDLRVNERSVATVGAGCSQDQQLLRHERGVHPRIRDCHGQRWVAVGKNPTQGSGVEQAETACDTFGTKAGTASHHRDANVQNVCVHIYTAVYLLDLGHVVLF